MSKLPERIYKYLPVDRIDVLKNRRIRFTQPGDFNDPFELQVAAVQIAKSKNLAESFDEHFDDHVARAFRSFPQELREAIDEYGLGNLKGEWRQFIKDQWLQRMKNPDRMLSDSRFPPVDRQIGILSLSEVPDSLLMWAHYASNHRGLLIEFDPTQRFFDQKRNDDDEFFHLRRVEYSPQRDVAGAAGALDSFLRKSEEWSYEREWRLARPLTADDDVVPATPYPVHLVPFPPEAVLSVTLGARASDEVRAEVANLRKSDQWAHLPVFATKLSKDEFALETENVGN